MGEAECLLDSLTMKSEVLKKLTYHVGLLVTVVGAVLLAKAIFALD